VRVCVSELFGLESSGMSIFVSEKERERER
jgi:hypothetical protein